MSNSPDSGARDPRKSSTVIANATDAVIAAIPDHSTRVLATVLNSEIRRVYQKAKESKEVSEENRDNLKNLTVRVLGDKEMKQKGMVDDVEATKNYIEKQKLDKAKLLGAAAVISILMPIIFELAKMAFAKTH